MPGGRPPSDEKQRFLAKVEKVSSGCHEWQAGINRGGYGKLWFRGECSVPAHRVAHTLFIGAIPEGGNVLHRCDNRKCVNPEHLFLGTQRENIYDMDDKGRRGTKSSLTYSDVDEIRKMLADRYSQEVIAKKFGVDQTTISRIKLRKTFLFKEN